MRIVFLLAAFLVWPLCILIFILFLGNERGLVMSASEASRRCFCVEIFKHVKEFSIALAYVCECVSVLIPWRSLYVVSCYCWTYWRLMLHVAERLTLNMVITYYQCSWFYMRGLWLVDLEGRLGRADLLDKFFPWRMLMLLLTSHCILGVYLCN